MSYHGLEARFVPLVSWPGPRNPNPQKALFKATTGNTIKLLKVELAQLGAENVVIQMEGDESQLRQDGYPRADGRFGDAVIVTFDSIHGPLSYPCDRFDGWWNNLRAIALALEALRKVDRYGVTKRGEQYTGWKALPGAGESSTTMTAQQAAAFLSTACGGNFGAAVLLTDRTSVGLAYRDAAKRMHPDVLGGSHDAMATLSVAKRILEQHHARR